MPPAYSVNISRYRRVSSLRPALENANRFLDKFVGMILRIDCAMFDNCKIPPPLSLSLYIYIYIYIEYDMFSYINRLSN